MTSKLLNSIRKFHTDEEGLEALQVVMIIAIASMIMIASATVGQKTVTWMNGKWTALQGASISADNSGGGLINSLNGQNLGGMGIVPPGVVGGGGT